MLLVGSVGESWADTGFWASIGYASVSVDTALPTGRDAPFAIPPADFADYSDSGVRVAVGWQRNWLGFEAGWADFGSKVRLDEEECNIPPGGQIVCPAPGTFFYVTEQTGSATWIAFTPTYEAGSWTVGAKVGVARVRVEAALQGFSGSMDGYDRSVRAMYGISGTFAVTRQLALRADLDAFHDRAHTIGLSAMLRF